MSTKAHQHAVGSCSRCDTTVEPTVSKQWFVKMKPLAEPAIEAVKKGLVEFIPSRFAKLYLNWVENVRDWCISGSSGGATGSLSGTARTAAR